MTSTRALGNGGADIVAGDYSLIGGPAPASRNLISAALGSFPVSADGRSGSFGIFIGTFQAVVQGNFIGTDVTGRNPLGSGNEGIRFEGTDANLIGGPGAGNVTSGSHSYGVWDLSGGAGNMFQGNFIGTDVTGTKALPNSTLGIRMNGHTDVGDTIGTWETYARDTTNRKATDRLN